MGLSELVARLERDARARVEAIEARAREAIASIEAEAARAASVEAEGALADRRAAWRARFERELSLARRRASDEILRSEQALVDRVMRRAAELLEEANGDETYRMAARDRIATALELLPDGPVVVRCRPDLAAVAREALLGRAGATLAEDASMPAGFVAASGDGSVAIDQTLPSRLGRMRDALAMELHARWAPAKEGSDG